MVGQYMSDRYVLWDILVLSAIVALLSVPLFVYLKNRNDSSIVTDTKRIAEAMERAYPIPLELREPREPR